MPSKKKKTASGSREKGTVHSEVQEALITMTMSMSKKQQGSQKARGTQERSAVNASSTLQPQLALQLQGIAPILQKSIRGTRLTSAHLPCERRHTNALARPSIQLMWGSHLTPGPGRVFREWISAEQNDSQSLHLLMSCA